MMRFLNGNVFLLGMEEKHYSFANAAIENFDITPKEAWWRLCPGSNTIDWFKADKSDYSTGLIAFGYIFEPTKDLLKTAFYGAALGGFIVLGAAAMGHPELMQSLEGILIK